MCTAVAQSQRVPDFVDDRPPVLERLSQETLGIYGSGAESHHEIVPRQPVGARSRSSTRPAQTVVRTPGSS